MLNCFSEENSRQVVRRSFTLELSLSLIEIPSFNMKISNVEIKTLRNYRAGGDCPIGSRGRFVLFMAFKKYNSIHSIDLLNVSIVHITDKIVQKKVEMFPTSRASIIVMVDCDAINILNFWLHLLQ